MITFAKIKMRGGNFKITTEIQFFDCCEVLRFLPKSDIKSNSEHVLIMNNWENVKVCVFSYSWKKEPLHKKLSFPMEISSVNVTKAYILLVSINTCDTFLLNFQLLHSLSIISTCFYHFEIVSNALGIE